MGFSIDQELDPEISIRYLEPETLIAEKTGIAVRGTVAFRHEAAPLEALSIIFLSNDLPLHVGCDKSLTGSDDLITLLVAFNPQEMKNVTA
jgi:hypothetical protein